MSSATLSKDATAAFEKSSALAPHYARALVNRARLALLRATDAGAAPTPEEDEESDGDADATPVSSP